MDNFRPIFTSRFSKKKTTTNVPQKKNDIVPPYNAYTIHLKKLARRYSTESYTKAEEKKNVRTHTAIRLLSSGHCGGVGTQRIEIYIYIYR